MRQSRLNKGLYTAPRKLALAAAVAMAVSTPTTVFAQGLVLEEIIVTATKKDEMVQDVPSTINVLTGDSMKNLNVFDFKDIETLTPGLSLTNIDARNNSIAMRGVSFNPDSRAAAAVVVYQNGIPIRPDLAFQQMYDLSRVEVLRGPQGTLQGETSPAGSIQLYTKKANLDAVEGEVIQTISDNEGFNTQLAVSVPVIEGKLAVRVSGLYDESETGIDTHSSVGGRTGTRDTQSGRFGVSWLPIDELTIDANYQYMENRADGHAIVEGDNDTGPALDFSDRTSLSEGQSKIFNRFEFANLEVNYEMDEHLITWLTGYQETINQANEDKDSANLVSISAPVGDFADPTAYSAGWEDSRVVDTEIRRVTQELRITNTEADFWEYTAGLFYQKSDSNTFNSFLGDQAINPRNLPNPPIASAPFLPDAASAMVLDGPITLQIPIVTETYGAFLDNKWYVSDETTVGMGVRWTKNRSSTAAMFDTSATGSGDPVVDLIGDETTQKGIAWTGGLKVTHDLNEEVMVYASYDRSYRPAGYTITPDADKLSVDDLGFDEETSNSFEVGFKSTLDNGRYQINGALFYQDFTDYISRAGDVAFDDSGDGNTDSIVAGGITYNGDAVIQGAELELNAVITENWTGFIGASYTDGKFDDGTLYSSELGAPTNDGQFITSSTDGRIGAEPNWSITASSEYLVPMGDLEGFVRGLYKFTGSRTDDAANTHVGSYALFDMFVGVRDMEQSWEVSLWAKNLFDRDAITAYGETQAKELKNLFTGFGSFDPPQFVDGYQIVSVTQERQIGITAKYRFGAF